MKQEVKDALRTITTKIVALRSAKGAGRMFELYVMTGVAIKFKRDPHRYDVWLEKSDGTPIVPTNSGRRFIQRGGAPGGMDAHQTGKASYIVIYSKLQNRTWELWNGIQFEGRGGFHEVDIALIPRLTGTTLRGKPNGGNPLGRPRVSIECKDMKSNATLDEMRAFIARMYDLTLLAAHLPYYPQATEAINPASGDGVHNCASSYFADNTRTFNAVARQAGFSAGALGLAPHYKIRPYHGIVAGSVTADTLFTDVKNWCDGQNY